MAVVCGSFELGCYVADGVQCKNSSLTICCCTVLLRSDGSGLEHVLSEICFGDENGIEFDECVVEDVCDSLFVRCSAQCFEAIVERREVSRTKRFDGEIKVSPILYKTKSQFFEYEFIDYWLQP